MEQVSTNLEGLSSQIIEEVTEEQDEISPPITKQQ